MKMARGMMLAVFASTILALVLSFLPSVNRSQLNRFQDLPVFEHSGQRLVLSQSNIPDVILNQSYREKLTRIDLEKELQILNVDFLVNPAKASKLDVYNDLLKMIQTGLADTVNVNQLLVRVFIQDGEQAPVLGLALTANKNQAQSIEWKSLDLSNNLQSLLEQTFQITYKQKWDQLR